MTQDRTRNERAADVTVSAPDRPTPEFAKIPSALGLTAPYLHALWSAALSSDRAACHAVIHQALAEGYDRTVLADFYVPAVAHQLGEMWCEDQLGFADVTIGTARLQAILRELGPEWTADLAASVDAPLILLISPQNDQHTLGTVLVAGQLRRRGYSVRMALDPSSHDLQRLMRQITFDAVFISASQSESLEKLRRMIDFTRKNLKSVPPFVLGGGILEIHDHVASLVGVEIATSNIDEAIEQCDLTLLQAPDATHVSKD